MSHSLWMGLVAQVPCVVCAQLGYGDSPSVVHHMRDGNLGMRKSDYLTIALCPEHHVGKHSIHADRDSFERQFGTELDLLVATHRGVEQVLKRRGVRA